LSCIRCGDETEESAYLCENCSEACYQDPIFFFPPSLIGEGVVGRLRRQSSALVRLGPVVGGDIERVAGQSFFDSVSSFNAKKASEQEAKDYCKVADFVLGQYGVPLYTDHPALMLTEEASKVVAVIAQKVNSLTSQYPNLIMSDAFVRMGLIYWGASRSVLLRSGPVEWCRDKRKYTLSKALEYLEKIPKNDDLYSVAMKMSGQILLDMGAYPEAEEKLSSARKSFPDDIVLVRSLARAHVNLGNLDEAISLLDHAIVIQETAEIWFEKGEYLRRGGRSDEAIAAFEEAISIDRNFIRAYRALILLLRQMGKEEDAQQKEADMKVALDPGAVAKLEEMLQMEAMVPSEDASTKARREPLVEHKPKIKKEEIKDYLKSANKALKSGDFDLAIEILKMELATKGPKDSGTLILLCRAFLYNGQFDKAAKVINELLKREKDSASAWYWRAKIEFAEGRWGSSIQHLEKATKILPSFVDAHAEKGLIYLANQRYGEAEEAFGKALEFDKKDARSYLGRAKALTKLDRWGAAIQAINSFLEIIPDSREGLLMKAELLLDKGRNQEAERAFAKYLELEPMDPKAWCERGVALQSLGLSSDAVTCFNKCLELDPKNQMAAKWMKQIAGGESNG
jgi:tetratricopeptide (TPR) repeat protein